ncbi:MAG: hypothetical protein SOY16_02745 [Akkermansia muciniphila]|uniref:hypothetical protein n=1 Tax=Akkermansia muciniphila TaxID=239935 RepID=UPI001F1EA336|nr:hypothetical protein [Akkermansia muciniphila]MCI5894264.1 hypothetical protein [Akkermansia muciniphila]MCL6677535.1 hypothetical protein [Akkermansia muciniphila]MDY4124130.1 hypothetical protein [Akkermansia muciniphila]
MKKIFRYLILLASLSLHAAAWGDMADNGVECSVVMEKTRFDARETFPDFKLVFTNKGEARSMAAAEEQAPLTLSIADTSRFREGRITVRFRNEGNEPVRIPDEINDETSDFFFVTVLRTERGNFRVLNRKVGKITFNRSLNYRELAPGQEYSVTIPVCLDEVDLEGWKQCSCELETRYYNQQGKDCFRGMLRATARLALQ